MFFVSLHIKESPQRGRGVYALEAISSGDWIEEAPVIVLSAQERVLIDQTKLHDYIFEWTPEGTSQCIMALGYVPIYNHHYHSNAEYFMDYEQQLIRIIAVKDIAAGEEICINYNGDADNLKPLWFEVK